ncbi:MAG TPA: hypothetical protein VEN29_02730 [Casimicrobiaceae bacterium]|nr:hypothetical protein [Casimicrobiaceae bacterium]
MKNDDNNASTSEGHPRRARTKPGDQARVDACQPIWEAMWEGQTCFSACRELGGRNGVPAWSTLKEWISTDPAIAANYARAREAWADYHFDAMLEIADTPQIGETVVTKANGTVEVRRGDMVERARLQIDARKWIIARAAPKKYGNRIEQTIQGGDQPIKTVSEMIDFATIRERVEKHCGGNSSGMSDGTKSGVRES